MTERMNFQAVYCRLFSVKLKVTAALTIGGGSFYGCKGWFSEALACKTVTS